MAHNFLLRKDNLCDMLDYFTSNNLASSTMKVRIYTGSMPALLTSSATGTLLAELDILDTTAFGSTNTTTLVKTGNLVGGLWANTDAAIASGDPGYFRVLDNGGTARLQGTAGASGCDLNLTPATITAGVPVYISSATITITGPYT